MSKLRASPSKKLQQGGSSSKEVHLLGTLIALFFAVAAEDERVWARKRNQNREIVDDRHFNYLGEKENSSWPRVTAKPLTGPGRDLDLCMTVARNGRYYGKVYEKGTNNNALRRGEGVNVWAKPTRPGTSSSTSTYTIVYTVVQDSSTATPPAPAAGSKKRKVEEASVEEEILLSKRRRSQSQRSKDAAESEQLLRNWNDKGKEAASPSPRRRPVARRSAPRPQQQQQQQQQAPQLDLGRRNSLDSLDTLALVASVQSVEMFEDDPSDEETEAATILAEMSE